MSPLRAALLVAVSLTSACALPSTALWRAGAGRLGHEGVPLGAPRDPAGVEVRFKAEFGAFEATRARRIAMCGTTTILRRSALLEPPPGLPAGPPTRPYRVLAELTTDEYPRDERASRLLGDQVFQVFGVGNDPCDLFEVALDREFLPDALERLRAQAAALGADAVIEVFATGEAEHHMWHGTTVSLDPQSTRSPIYVNLRLLQLRLRDVRLHGRAVRYE